MLERDGVWTVSSQQLAEIEGLSSAQVRRDLSMFGSFGRRDVGYDVQVQSVVDRLSRIGIKGALYRGPDQRLDVNLFIL